MEQSQYGRTPFTIRSKRDRCEEADKDVRTKPLSEKALQSMMEDTWDGDWTPYHDLYRALVEGGYVVPVEE